jgi:hypothetical protein
MKKNEKSIENKSNLYSEANNKNAHISKSTLGSAITFSHKLY